MKTFYIKQRIFSIGDKYDIYDENSNAVYFVKGKIFAFTPQFTIYKTSSNTELYYIKKRFFTFLPQYDLYKNSMVVASVQKKFTLLTHKITVLSDYGDYNVTGDFLAHDFSIESNGIKIANITKKWFTFGDSYAITIYNDTDYEFYLSLVIMIDNCIHNSSGNHNH